MPAGRPSGNPFRNRRLREAAQDGMLVTLRCNACRKTVNYWAADLLIVTGDREVHVPPWPCSRCRTDEYVAVSWTIPSADQLRDLTVRRPVRKVERWIWRDERA